MSADPPRVFPVDDFVREELYPGYRQAFGSQPFVAGPVRPFSPADNERYWLRDSLHFSEGMVPASIATLDDAQTWGAQLGAEIVGVPPTRGSVNRLAGTHVYIGTIDVDTQWQVQARAARFGQYVSPILADFDSYWSMRAAELIAAYEHFDNLDLAAMSPAELWTVLKDAYAFHRRAWFIHFEVMYVLTANYLAFYALAEEIGLSGSQVSSFLSGRETFYSRTDEELWRLAGLARSLGVDAALTQRVSADMRVAGAGAAGRFARGWPSSTRSSAVYGQRTEETCRIDTPSWIEDPSPALYSHRHVPDQAGRVRLPRRPGGGRLGAGLADRPGPALAQRVGPDPVQPGAGVQPGRQLRLVERGAQLPDRPAGGDPGAPGDARARRAADRFRADLPPRRHVLPLQAGAVRGHGVGHRRPVGRAGGDDPRPAGLLRALARARAVAADHARHDPRHGARPDHDRGVRAVRALPGDAAGRRGRLRRPRSAGSRPPRGSRKGWPG